MLGKEINGIGKLIITKSPGLWIYEDLTKNYKHPEATEEERATMFKALRQSENMFARYYLNDDFNDIFFNLEMRDDIKIGQPFNVVLVMKNRHELNDYKVNLTLRVDSVSYTGKVGNCIKQNKQFVLIKAGSDLEVTIKVEYEEYSKKLKDQAAFSVSCLAAVEDTKFEYYTQDEFRVRKPDIKIVLPSVVKQNEEAVADIYLENPLPVPLSKCEFTVDAPGFKKKLTIKFKSNVLPGNKALVKCKFTPPASGNQTIAAKFTAKEMKDVDGFLNFVVQANKESNTNGNAA